MDRKTADPAPLVREPDAPHTEPVCETGTPPNDCAGMFTCCDCGGHECGCIYCWSCNACDACR